MIKLLSDQMITTPNGVKSVRLLKQGDFVINSEGYIDTIRRIYFSKSFPKISNITCFGCNLPLKCDSLTKVKTGHLRDIPAGLIRKNDVLYMPKDLSNFVYNDFIDLGKIIPTADIKNTTISFTKNSNPNRYVNRFIPINSDTIRLFG